METLQTLKEISYSNVSEKGSTFLGFLCPIHEFQSKLQLLKQEHPKAVHFVTSSRFLNEAQQLQESFSDDGEPRGSSGMPTLKVLRGYSLIDVGFVSVRYFGGTLLGVGGLVRAYTQSAKQAILEANLVPHKVLHEERWKISFDKINHIKYLSKKFDLILVEEDFFDMGVNVVCKGERKNLEYVKNILFGV